MARNKYLKPYTEFRQHGSFGNMFDSFETEVLYSLVREVKPKNIIEFGCFKGYSSYIILEAMRDNQVEGSVLHSFDPLSYSKKLDCKTTYATRELIVGKAEDNCDQYIDKTVDFIFIDADHSYDFGKWYSLNVLPKLESGTPIWIHDWEFYNCSNNYADEMEAVKTHAIDTKVIKPIMNLMDYVKANMKHSTSKTISRANGDRSPSQILKRI